MHDCTAVAVNSGLPSETTGDTADRTGNVRLIVETRSACKAWLQVLFRARRIRDGAALALQRIMSDRHTLAWMALGPKNSAL